MTIYKPGSIYQYDYIPIFNMHTYFHACYELHELTPLHLPDHHYTYLITRFICLIILSFSLSALSPGISALSTEVSTLLPYHPVYLSYLQVYLNETFT